jgi:hypothetical protein
MGKPLKKPLPAHPAYPDYAEDLTAWAQANAALLRAGRLAEVDTVNLAEELDDLGKSERRSLGSHIRNLLLHCLKWEYQPHRRGPSWRYSIDNARHEVQVIIRDSPSLRTQLERCVAEEYPIARRHAATQTGLPIQTFPEDPGYGSAELLAEDFPFAPL